MSEENHTPPLITASRCSSRLLRKNVSFCTPPSSGCNIKEVRQATPYSSRSTHGDVKQGKRTSTSAKKETGRTSSVKKEKQRISTGTKKENRMSASAKERKGTPRPQLKLTTPNFKRIHEKTFAGMESIEDYSNRVKENHQKYVTPLKVSSAKKNVRSVLFAINTATPGSVVKEAKTKETPLTRESSQYITPRKVTSAKKENVNSAQFAPNAATPGEVAKESKKKVFKFTGGSKSHSKDVHIVKKRFDLKGSLAKQLTYKPYKGALKPISEASKNKRVAPKRSEPLDRIKSGKREILKGIRTNRRFELQMMLRK